MRTLEQSVGNSIRELGGEGGYHYLNLATLVPLVVVCFLPLLYYKLVPKVGVLVWFVLYVLMTCVGVIAGLVSLYLGVLALGDYLGTSLGSTLGVWTTQAKIEAVHLAGAYQTVFYALSIFMLLLCGAVLPNVLIWVTALLKHLSNLVPGIPLVINPLDPRQTRLY